jgi:hypothetical protein
MRPVAHSYVKSLYFGTTEWDESLGHCDVVNVREIPGGEIMTTDEQLLQYRQEHGCEFQPWFSANWWEDVPWAK